jgi:hypothetical protein
MATSNNIKWNKIVIRLGDKEFEVPPIKYKPSKKIVAEKISMTITKDEIERIREHTKKSPTILTLPFPAYHITK